MRSRVETKYLGSLISPRKLIWIILTSLVMKSSLAAWQVELGNTWSREEIY